MMRKDLVLDSDQEDSNRLCLGLVQINDEDDGHTLVSSPTSCRSGTVFPLPPLTATIDLLDTRYCKFQDRSSCSNCFQKILYQTRAKKYTDTLCHRKTLNANGSEEKISVTVIEALDIVFELRRRSHLSEIILDDVEYIICSKCCCILSRLYKVYIDFTGRSKSPSYLKSIFIHNKSLRDHENSKPFHDVGVDNGSDHVEFGDEADVCENTIAALKCEVTCNTTDDEVDTDFDSLRKNHVNRLRKHTTISHKKKYKCESCRERFLTARRLAVHVRLAHTDREKGSVIDNGEELTKQNEQTNSTIKQYNCTHIDCTLRFTRTNHLRQHLLSKHNVKLESLPAEEPKKCPVCTAVFKSSGKLKNHLEKHRPLVRESKYECELCGKKYRDASNLRNHKTSHGPEKPFVCVTCGFSTKRSYQLTRHIEMVHIGIRSHHCTQCGVAFKKKQHLLDHELTHKTMEYRPYTCSIVGCSKAYRSRRNLRQHLEAHTGCKFQCETCGRIFTRKDNLKVHVDTVHMGKPGRTQKEKEKNGGTPRKQPKKYRTRKKEIPVASPIEDEPVLQILPDDGIQQHGSTSPPTSTTTHQLMIVDDPGLQLQQVPQTQYHHIITNPRIIQQTSIAGQNVVTIENTFGEFFYTI